MALLEMLSGHHLIVKDTTISEVIEFLDYCNEHGKNINTLFVPSLENEEKNTVGYQAREIKRLYLKIR